MTDLERAIETLTPDRLQRHILALVRGPSGEQRRGVGVATIAAPILDTLSFQTGAERSQAYATLTAIIAARVAHIPGMRYVEAMS